MESQKLRSELFTEESRSYCQLYNSREVIIVSWKPVVIGGDVVEGLTKVVGTREVG